MFAMRINSSTNSKDEGGLPDKRIRDLPRVGEESPTIFY